LIKYNKKLYVYIYIIVASLAEAYGILKDGSWVSPCIMNKTLSADKWNSTLPGQAAVIIIIQLVIRGRWNPTCVFHTLRHAQILEYLMMKIHRNTKHSLNLKYLQPLLRIGIMIIIIIVLVDGDKILVI
jgi:hypothetical protein